MLIYIYMYLISNVFLIIEPQNQNRINGKANKEIQQNTKCLTETTEHQQVKTSDV